MNNFTLEDLKDMLEADAVGKERTEFANVTFRMADGLPVVAAYIHDEDVKKIITLSDVEQDKRDPLQKGVIVTPEQAMIFWITMLQTYQQYNGEVGILKCKMSEDNDYVEIDIFQDDPTNLTDGTWTEPIMHQADEGDD